MIRAGDVIEPRHGRAGRLPRDLAGDERGARRDRDMRPAGRLRRRGACAPAPAGALRDRETATIEPGTPHKFWNAGDAVVRFRCEALPALQFEQLLETMFALATEGKTNKKGMPNPLRLAVIARAHFDVARLPFPPAPVQQLGLALGAPLGRLLGDGPTYVATGEPLAAST